MKKLDATPKKPYTQGDIQKAMSALHKLVLKQSHAYGGKHHKFIPAEVIETSLLKSVANNEEELFEAYNDEVDRCLDLCERTASDLEDHMKARKDEKGAQLVSFLLKRLKMAMSANK